VPHWVDPNAEQERGDEVFAAVVWDLNIGGGASRMGRDASQRWEPVMSLGSTIVVNAAGRRRSPATMPGYLAGRAPHNKGMQYPPDPPRAEEIVLVMRQAGRDRHGLRVRALIAVLARRATDL
jgi:DNA-binding transcriptional LysR family regulator